MTYFKEDSHKTALEIPTEVPTYSANIVEWAKTNWMYMVIAAIVLIVIIVWIMMKKPSKASPLSMPVHY